MEVFTYLIFLQEIFHLFTSSQFNSNSETPRFWTEVESTSVILEVHWLSGFWFCLKAPQHWGPCGHCHQSTLVITKPMLTQACMISSHPKSCRFQAPMLGTQDFFQGGIHYTCRPQPLTIVCRVLQPVCGLEGQGMEGHWAVQGSNPHFSGTHRSLFLVSIQKRFSSPVARQDT